MAYEEEVDVWKVCDEENVDTSDITEWLNCDPGFLLSYRHIYRTK